MSCLLGYATKLFKRAQNTDRITCDSNHFRCTNSEKVINSLLGKCLTIKTFVENAFSKRSENLDSYKNWNLRIESTHTLQRSSGPVEGRKYSSGIT